MPIHFGGINIHAKEPASSFAFYKGIGLKVKTEVEPESEWYGAEIELGDGALLWIWRDHSDSDTENTGRMIV